MHHGIVEGEPGIYPEPVARVLRTIGGFFRRGRGRDQEGSPPPPPDSDKPDEASSPPSRGQGPSTEG